MKDYKEKGWVRLWRKIEDNPLWFMESFTKAQAWVDLFLNANHKENQISIRGNILTIKRGQIAWSELTMAKRWTWSKNKVRRFLKYLETEQQIVQQKSSVTTILTINKYEEHQQNDTTDDTAERQQKDSRRYTNNNVKNVNKVENVKNNIYIEFINFFNSTFHREYKPIEDLLPNFIHWNKIYTLDEIKKAVKTAKVDTFWQSKITPTILLRKKNPQGEAVDYIGGFINKERKWFSDRWGVRTNG